MFENQLIIALTALGFTENEAKLYLTIREKGPVSGYAAARSSGVSRARTYASVADMINKGFIQEIPNDPPLYEAVPIETILANAEKREAQLIASAEKALSTIDTSKSRQDGIIQLFGYKNILKYLNRQIACAEKSITLYIRQNEFSTLEENLRAATQRGVTFQLIAAARSKDQFTCNFASTVVYHNILYSMQAQRGNHWIICTIDNAMGILGEVSDVNKSMMASTANPQLINLLNDFFLLHFVAQEFAPMTEKNPIVGHFNDEIFELYKKMI